jgi:hypothetical protein
LLFKVTTFKVISNVSIIRFNPLHHRQADLL